MFLTDGYLYTSMSGTDDIFLGRAHEKLNPTIPSCDPCRCGGIPPLRSKLWDLELDNMRLPLQLLHYMQARDNLSLCMKVDCDTMATL